MSVEEDAFKAELNELRKRVESLEQWAGNNSELSQKKQETTTNENETKDQQPVLTTDNLSEKTEAEFSDVTSTDGPKDSWQ
jgi:hypothetical protein